ncbi:hypothetical protein F4680DRAFT_239075 [Xylaria scruposa]|nr:hypothetical protein F4680DRAFT_239075 [Xylaria scruposa]
MSEEPSATEEPAAVNEPAAAEEPVAEESVAEEKLAADEPTSEPTPADEPVVEEEAVEAPAVTDISPVEEIHEPAAAENTKDTPEPAAAEVEAVAEAPVDDTPTEDVTSKEIAVEEAPAQDTVAEEPPVEEPAADEAPATEAPAEIESAEEAPAPAEEAPVAEPVVEAAAEEPVVEEPAAAAAAEEEEADTKEIIVEEPPTHDTVEHAVEATPAEAAAEAVAEEAPASAPPSEETPAAEEADAVEEAPIVEEAAIVEKALVTEEAPAAEEALEKAPAVEEAPVEEAIVPEEAPVPEEVPATEQAPIIVESIAAEEALPAQEAPAAEQLPVVEETPAAEEPPVVEEAPITEVVPAEEEAPIEEAATSREVPLIEEVPVSVEAPPAEEHAPAVEETPGAEDTAAIDEAPAEEHPVVEEAPAKAPAVEPADIIERELPTTEAAAVAIGTEESVSREMPPVAAEPDAPKPQPDAVEQPRDDRTREVEESKDIVGPIRGEEKSSRRRRSRVAPKNNPVVDSSPGDSTLGGEHSAAEPLLPHEPYRARDEVGGLIIGYNNRNIRENWPFATNDINYGEALSEDSAWETLDEDERLDPSWGNIETPEDKHPPSADSKTTHELRKDDGHKDVDQGVSHESIPPEIDIRDLPSSDSAHLEESGAQELEEEMLHDIAHPKPLEAPSRSSPIHQFASSKALSEGKLSDNQEQWALEVEPPNDGLIHGGQSFSAVDVNQFQRQFLFEDSTDWSEPEAKNPVGSRPTTFQHPQYFDAVSENYDDEFIMKSDTTGFVDGSLKINSSALDDSTPRYIPAGRFSVAGGTSDEAQASTSTRPLDETCPVVENERQGWPSTLEEEDDDADIETHQLPHVFDYARFISEIPAARPSRVVEETHSDEEFGGFTTRVGTWRRNISHSGQGLSITRGKSKASRNNFNWSSSSSSSLEQSDQERFEPLLNDEHLGTIDVAFVPSQTLRVTQTQDRILDDAGISDLELESTTPSETQDVNVGLSFYGPQHDQSDELASVADIPLGPRGNITQTDAYFEPPATAIGDELYTHGFTPKNDVHQDVFSSFRGIQRPRSYDSSRDSELLEELPIVPTLTVERAGTEFNRQLLLARFATNEDHRDRVSRPNSVASNSFEYADPINFGVDSADGISSFENRPIPPKSIRRTRRPILVHSSTQTDEELLHDSSRGSNRSFSEDQRSATPAIVLPNLRDPNAKALGRIRSLRRQRQQRFQEAEEAVATAVVIYATAQELSDPSRPCHSGDQVNENIVEIFGATQGPVQVSSDSVPLGIATEYSDDESDFSPTVADLSTDDEGRDHHRHRTHRSHHHSPRDRDRKSSDEHRPRRHRHKSGDDSKVSLKTGSDRSIPSQHKKEESRRYDSGHERSYDSEHRKRRTPEEKAAHERRKEERTPEEQAAHERRKEARRARREQERETERIRERDYKGKETETTPPPDNRNSPRSSRRSGNSNPERHVSIKEEAAPVSSKKFFDFRRGESTLAAANVSSKPESHRDEVPKRSSPPTSTSKSHSRSHREHSDAPRPRSSRRHDEAREDRPRSSRHHDEAKEDRPRSSRHHDETREDRPRSSRHHDEAREDPSKRHRERSSRPQVDDEPKISSRSMADSEGRYTTRSRADSDTKGSTRSRGDSDGRPPSSSHAKPRSSDIKEDRHAHSSKRAERQRERDAERKKKEAPSGGLKSVFKKLFA